jgi:mono/diheme cytochrome c family protein
MKTTIEFSQSGPRRRTSMPHLVLFAIVLSAVFVTVTKSEPVVDQTLPSNYVPSGQVMFKQYCATCHGIAAKGDGPLGSFLKVPPPDLTKLAQRHGGKFPYDDVARILRFGPGPSSHGSSDMPTWGPLFEYLDRTNERAVQQRIKNLCDYLASLQEH